MLQKTWHCDDSRPIPGLIQEHAIVPIPGPGELLIQIHAAGITPTELLWYPSTHTQSGENRRNAIPGHEFSGVVVAVGSDAGPDFSVGQAVFGMNDWFASGATAEFCCTRMSSVAPKLARLTHAAAATVPIGALTAWQGLFDRVQLQPGERVLIHGGSGAIGVLAIQLAVWRGAQVWTTASARHQDLLIRLGAQRVIDYRTERFEDIVKEVDVVFDGVGGATLQRSWNVFGTAGRLVTVATSSEATEDERTKQAFFIVEPSGTQLCEIASLFDSGILQPVVNAVVPFDQAALAYLNQSMPKHGCGKTVISLIHGG
ncbi:MAG: Alcohol dehydrogenase zinc-binding domain protein [Planctomycetaceae bacterium]|nr:Alcohol dehydrogenase zinc-binding domain protein [Planctomycetaceae bacterium]